MSLFAALACAAAVAAMPPPPESQVSMAQITSADRAPIVQVSKPIVGEAAASSEQVRAGAAPVPDGPVWVATASADLSEAPDAALLYDAPPPPDGVDVALRLLTEGRTDGSEIAAAIALRQLRRGLRPSPR
jgi:hypothetical protein